MNIISIADSLPENCTITAVVKGDAYGLGISNVVPVIDNYVGMYAVSSISEGVDLRQYTEKNILVLGNPVISALNHARENNLTLSVSHLGLIPLLEDGTNIHIDLNTKMNRTGLDDYELDDLISELSVSNVIVTGAYTHEGDYEKFMSMVEKINSAGFSTPMLHFCDSQLYESHPEYALNSVRLGRRLYSDAPNVFDSDIKECVSWRAFITDIHPRKANSALGYGGNIHLLNDSRIANISVGTGDGLNRDLIKENAPVLINGKRCPILVSFMDQTLVDVSDVECKIGDTVTLLGYDENGLLLPAQEIGQLADLESVDMYTAVGPRTKRISIQ